MIDYTEYEAAKKIVVEYEQQQGLRPVYECVCKLLNRPPGERDACPFSQEVHNDNLLCTRKSTNRKPIIKQIT